MHFFFYGTLLDAEVRRAVMPHLADDLLLQPARLQGYRRVRARRATYPVLVGHPRRAVDGLLAGGLDARALFRMAQFEGDRYLPRRLGVRAADGRFLHAWVFMPARASHAASGDWCIRRWRSRHKRRLLGDIGRWMTEFGSDTGRAHDLNWPFRRTIQALAADLEAQERRARLRRAA